MQMLGAAVKNVHIFG